MERTAAAGVQKSGFSCNGSVRGRRGEARRQPPPSLLLPSSLPSSAKEERAIERTEAALQRRMCWGGRELESERGWGRARAGGRAGGMAYNVCLDRIGGGGNNEARLRLAFAGKREEGRKKRARALDGEATAPLAAHVRLSLWREAVASTDATDARLERKREQRDNKLQESGSAREGRGRKSLIAGKGTLRDRSGGGRRVRGVHIVRARGGFGGGGRGGRVRVCVCV